MKALIYKEFKLALHPICYVFVFLFPFLLLVPNYPVVISFIYIMCCYPILFLGANKGQQSNDLLFSTLMPVRKKDIVAARLITVSVIQIFAIAFSACLLPLANYVHSIAFSQAGSGQVPPTVPGLSLDGYLSISGITLVGYALADLIYFSIYYKKGKSIVASSLFSIFFFALYIILFTVIIPFLPNGEAYKKFLCDSGIGPQFLIFGIGLVLYIAIHYIVYRVASKELEKVDF